MIETLTHIYIDKESHKFSAAHFTVFSAVERERLHGHNFSVSAEIVALADDNGLTGDYAVYKARLRDLCESVDEYMLLPAHSPYLEIDDRRDHYRVLHNGEEMLFLKSDTLLLPIRNTTVEDLSRYLLEKLVADTGFIEAQAIHEIEVRVSSGPGQTGGSRWQR